MFRERVFVAFVALAASISPVLSAPALDLAIEQRAITYKPVSFKTIYVPPRNYNKPKTLYGRTVQLADGTLLATWENYSVEKPLVYFPVHRSTDGGNTWSPFSNITDTVNNWGLRYQPFLYLLPQALGSLPAGTILAAGVSIPTDLSKTKIDIYSSTNGGLNWKFLSTVVSGGKAVPDNGETPVWEPFLMVYNNQLVIYYSSQTDLAHGQKLCHQVSSNGLSWGPIVNDVAYPAYARRPGMATIAQLPNGKYILTYENVGISSPSGSGNPVYYRLSSNPLLFDSAPEFIVGANGVYPSSSPFVVWTPAGGANGTIVVSANSHTDIFINTKLGDAGSWTKVATPQSGAYSREIRVLSDPNWLHIISAGFLGGDNYVTNSVFKVPGV
ncbi:related to BNR/Asp-box repeat domain protein [Rhynchosporium agropyri]|uniref:Related to BNR/Asp-box repeat domain protein n=1 Tax=Rhynchosporium agropyri TaxID=914238 RepID=A0A1E1KET2_9HELO|nr:related to BNR/Asp-box repeat domain protein [Rhynchosporium agropyri]